MTWPDARLYCQFLEIDGYSDWRMPTHEEWRMVIDAALPEFYFEGNWTDETYPYGSHPDYNPYSLHWVDEVIFNAQTAKYGMMNKNGWIGTDTIDYLHNIRPVRTREVNT